jgi:hypothetical protein
MPDSVLVRLDPQVTRAYPDTLVFRAAGLTGLATRPDRPVPMLWIQLGPTDTLEVILPNVSPLVWRFRGEADSLEGLLYVGNDMSFGLYRAGAASGARAPCPQ